MIMKNAIQFKRNIYLAAFALLLLFLLLGNFREKVIPPKTPEAARSTTHHSRAPVWIVMNLE